MLPGLRALAGVAATLSLSSCCCFCLADCYQTAIRTTRTLVVVVPAAADGHIGTVVVNPDQDRLVLHSAYAGAYVDAENQPATYNSSPEEIEAIFAVTRQAKPPQPVFYTAFFVLGTDQLSPESADVLNQVVAETRRRADAEISVIGHTDRVGSEEGPGGIGLNGHRTRVELVGPLASFGVDGNPASGKWIES